MADTQTTTKTVNMTLEFGDGSEKTISQNDPLSDQTTLISRINAFGTYATNNNIFISDNNASFSRIKSAKIVSRTATKLDLIP